jgi:hypothetical protein
MSCDYLKALSKYVDHELANEDTVIMEKHLSSCDSCKSELKMISSLKAAFSKGKIDSKAEFFWQKLKFRISQEISDKAKEESFAFDFSNWTKRLIPLPVVITVVIIIINLIPVNKNLVDEYIFGTSFQNVSGLLIDGTGKSTLDELLY